MKLKVVGLSLLLPLGAAVDHWGPTLLQMFLPPMSSSTSTNNGVVFQGPAPEASANGRGGNGGPVVLNKGWAGAIIGGSGGRGGPPYAGNGGHGGGGIVNGGTAGFVCGGDGGNAGQAD